MDEKKVRLNAAIGGLLSLIIANATIAMQLQERPARPVIYGVSDMVNNEGWLLASYQLYPWWLSEMGVPVSVSRLGNSGDESQIRLEYMPISFTNISLNYDEGPLRIDDADGFRDYVSLHNRLTDGHRVMCRQGREPSLGPCVFNIAFEEAGLNDGGALDLVAVELGDKDIALVETSLMSDYYSEFDRN